METPKISTAEDFQARNAALRTQQAVPFTLPSGLTLSVYRPSTQWWLRHLGRLPESFARFHFASAGEPSTDPEQSKADMLAFSMWATALLGEMVISPKICLNPKEGEIDPSWIDDTDFAALMAFAGGETDAGAGEGLRTFRGGSGADAGAGPQGGAVALPSERPA